ncbi:MAG TPA: 2-phospho-L-lactate transferase CofD family protein, partial [Acidimicrobiia bacterium]|nr:2-phospho-L-lactate transferase CofD family protein [Acidimicrobiia bacterium]
AGHALGNLVLVGLAETFGSMSAALDEAGRLLGAVGRVVPATADAVSIAAQVGGREIVGQVAIAEAGAHARISDVRLVPDAPPAGPGALDAIASARQIVWAPGSLFTSIVAVCCVPEVRAAIRDARAPVVQVANLETENETTGLDGTDHLRVVLDHGGRVDVLLYDNERGLVVDEAAVRALGVEPISRPIAASETEHDPKALAAALASLG